MAMWVSGTRTIIVRCVNQHIGGTKNVYRGIVLSKTKLPVTIINFCETLK